MLKAAIVQPTRLRCGLFGALLLILAACAPDTPQSLIASGDAYYAKKDFKAASLQYKTALQRDPRSMEARRRLGDTLLILGDLDGALIELTRALDDKAEMAAVLPILSRALVLGGQYRKLVGSYGEVTLDDPAGQAELKTNVAIAWGGLRELAKVAPAVEAALKAVPNYGPAMVVKARYLASGGQFDEALALLDGVVARNPKSYEAWLLRGELLDFAKQDSKQGEESYRKAVDADPTYVPAHSAIIMARIRQSDLAGAKAQADKLRVVLPKHPYTALVDAQIAYADGKPARAREILQTLLRAFPDHPGILLLSGSVEAQLGSVTMAAAQLGKALRYNPSLDAARRKLAEIETRQGQYSQAMATLKPLLERPQADPAALALAGDAQLRLRNPAAAEKYYAQASKADPTNLRFQAAAAMTRLSTGDGTAALNELHSISARSKDTYAEEMLFAAHMQRREFDAALATLEGMTRKEPERAALTELRGQVHLARRDSAAARAAFEQAVKADPGLFSAVVQLARMDVAEGKTAQAIARLQESTRLNPANAAAWLLLADLKQRESGATITDIRAIYAEAIRGSPTAVAPRLQLIDYLMRKSQFKDALAAAQSAAAAIPGDVLILDAVGQTQMRAGDLEQAATTFRKLAIAVPTSPEPYMRLASLYSAAGKGDQAESALYKAIEINPGYVPAQMGLVDLLTRSSREKDALTLIRRIKQSRPDDPLGYALEAIFHDRKKDVDAGVAVLREGAARTGNSDLAVRLFALLTQAKREAAAGQFASAWLKQHPKDAAFEYVLSVVELGRKDYKSAEPRLRRVLAIQANHVGALNNLAWLLVTTGGPGGLGFAQRAADVAPDEPPVLDTLALALAADKQVPAALEVQRRAVELAPEAKQLRLNYAKLAIQAGDKALARQELLQLQKLGAAFPAQDEVARLLQSL